LAHGLAQGFVDGFVDGFSDANGIFAGNLTSGFAYLFGLRGIE
jgi:hypothetical protein